jgi:quinol monooxygenase YgiN
MVAFNVVRFKVKSGKDADFLAANDNVSSEWGGLRSASIIRTGEQTYCLIAEWEDTDALTRSRPQMIATLNTFRHLLDELGDGLGVTDAVSGSVAKVLK